MELNEAIACVHESMEGRYNLTGEDEFYIHSFLCEFARMKNKKIIPVYVITKEFEYEKLSSMEEIQEMEDISVLTTSPDGTLTFDFTL